jgi:hypothetical protein
MSGPSVWRSSFGDVEIELDPDIVDPNPRDASMRELRRLVHDFKYRVPEALRTVLSIYRQLRGVDGRGLPHAVGFDFDVGSPRAEALGEELLHAGRVGRLIARRRQVSSVIFRIEGASEPVLGPDSSEAHIYTVRVLDDTGAPITGAKLSLDIAGDKQDKTTDGSGKVTVEKPQAGTAVATLTNLDELRDKLWPQWSKPLADRPPAGDQVLQAVVSQPIAPLRAPSDWLITLVLQRPPIWRVRMVGMIFDADKCFLLPQALDGIRSIVAMHQARPAAKVLIVGHEGGDEAHAGIDIALARAKALAAYLTSKPDDWMPWFDSDKAIRQRWGTREVQLMLSVLPGPDGAPLYQGTASGVTDDKTTKAIRDFQTAVGLPVDGKPGSSTKKALVAKYMGLEDTSLTAGVQPVSHGCTGHEDDTLTQDGLQPDDRRIEILFFDTDIKPPPSGDTSAPGSPEYPAWRMRLVQTVDFENHGVHVQVLDAAQQPVPFANVHLDGPTTEDTTSDEHGFVSFFGLVAGEYMVTGMTKSGQKVAPAKLTYPTAKTVAGTLRGQQRPVGAAAGAASP